MAAIALIIPLLVVEQQVTSPPTICCCFKMKKKFPKILFFQLFKLILIKKLNK
jgi:hypothetical protein